MLFYKSYIVLVALVVAVAARDRTQCEIKHNIVADDWKTFRENPHKPSEKLLCFILCADLEIGVLNADGIINSEKMSEGIAKWRPQLSEAEKAEALECTKKLAPVKTCEDVKNIIECLYKDH